VPLPLGSAVFIVTKTSTTNFNYCVGLLIIRELINQYLPPIILLIFVGIRRRSYELRSAEDAASSSKGDTASSNV